MPRAARSCGRRARASKRVALGAAPRRHPRRKGATTVEFALVGPLFFLFVFGLFEMVRMSMLHQALTDASRTGVRTAALATTIDPAVVENVVREELKPAIGPTATKLSKVRVTINPVTLANVSSESVLTVGVEMDYSDATWLPVQFLGLDPVIKAQARRERE